MIINHDDRESYRTLLQNSIHDNNHHYCESLRTQWNKIQGLGVNDDICDVVIALYHMQHTQQTSRNDDTLIKNIISEASASKASFAQSLIKKLEITAVNP